MAEIPEIVDELPEVVEAASAGAKNAAEAIVESAPKNPGFFAALGKDFLRNTILLGLATAAWNILTNTVLQPVDAYLKYHWKLPFTGKSSADLQAEQQAAEAAKIRRDKEIPAETDVLRQGMAESKQQLENNVVQEGTEIRGYDPKVTFRLLNPTFAKLLDENVAAPLTLQALSYEGNGTYADFVHGQPYNMKPGNYFTPKMVKGNGDKPVFLTYNEPDSSPEAAEHTNDADWLKAHPGRTWVLGKFADGTPAAMDLLDVRALEAAAKTPRPSSDAGNVQLAANDTPPPTVHVSGKPGGLPGGPVIPALAFAGLGVAAARKQGAAALVDTGADVALGEQATSVVRGAGMVKNVADMAGLTMLGNSAAKMFGVGIPLLDNPLATKLAGPAIMIVATGAMVATDLAKGNQRGAAVDATTAAATLTASWGATTLWSTIAAAGAAGAAGAVEGAEIGAVAGTATTGVGGIPAGIAGGLIGLAAGIATYFVFKPRAENAFKGLPSGAHSPNYGMLPKPVADVHSPYRPASPYSQPGMSLAQH